MKLKLPRDVLWDWGLDWGVISFRQFCLAFAKFPLQSFYNIHLCFFFYPPQYNFPSIKLTTINWTIIKAVLGDDVWL